MMTGASAEVLVVRMSPRPSRLAAVSVLILAYPGEAFGGGTGGFGVASVESTIVVAPGLRRSGNGSSFARRSSSR